MARLPVLMYHHVALHDSKDLTISAEKLEAQFSYLAQKEFRTFHFRDLDKWDLSGSKRNIVITFDDAYSGAVIAGVEEVVQRGLPATIFVTPSFVDGGAFWWDEVADPASGEVPAPLREHCLWALEGRAEAVRNWGDAAGLARQEMPEHQRGASQHDIARAAENPGITLGNHTWSHANLAALAPEQLAAELSQPMTWLRERFESVIPWVSYPYGLHSQRVERAVHEAGLDAGMRVDGGWMDGTRDDNLFRLPRLNIPSGLTVAGFQLRTSGLR